MPCVCQVACPQLWHVPAPVCSAGSWSDWLHRGKARLEGIKPIAQPEE